MAKFCPHCGKATVKVMDGGRLRDACPAGHFTQYARTSVGVGAMIFRENKVLLLQRGIPPVGLWTLINGYVEDDEPIDEAIKREAKEEVGLDISPQGVIFVRNVLHNGISDIYIVFLATADPKQELKTDGVEITDARFLAPEEFHTVNISPYAHWFVITYLERKIEPWSWQPTGFDPPTTRIFTKGKDGRNL
jgi:NADH pyrophosphatase NudC (nudix superfamily)